MIYSLIDAVLLAALAYTGWRTAQMARELRRIRTGEGELARALREADSSINGAAHSIVMLRSEGVELLQTIEQRIQEAREIAGELEAEIRIADRKLQVANDAACAPGLPQTVQDNWLRLIESRLASASATKR